MAYTYTRSIPNQLIASSFLLIIILFCSCQTTTKKTGMTAEQLSALICQCAEPIVVYNDHLRSLMSSEQSVILTEVMAQGDTIMQTAEACITDQIMTTVQHLLSPELTDHIDLLCQLDKRTIDDLLRKLEVFEKATFK